MVTRPRRITIFEEASLDTVSFLSISLHSIGFPTSLQILDQIDNYTRRVTLRTHDRGLGILYHVRHAGPTGPWHLLAQPRRRGLFRPPDASARPGPPVPVRRAGVPAPDLHRIAARRRPGPGPPDRPAARGAPDHRPGIGWQ